MPPEETLEAAADEILRSHCGKPLTDIQRMILRESLAGKGYESMKGYATQHIKNEGTALWNLLSDALGEKVSKTNFKGALENWLKSKEIAKVPPDPRAYEPDTWVGRSTIIDELLSKLQNKTRLVWITGISGVGKTTLGECLACRAWETNPTFQWDYLEISEGQGPDFTTIAADLLAKLGDRELDPQERNDPKRLTNRLIRKLQSSCYWVQLDSLERLLNPEHGTEFADAHWVTFLRRCLTERDFGSRLVLTAQALPGALVGFSNRYPNFWEAKPLVGLSADGPCNEHLEFFGKHGVAVDEGNQAILSKLGQVYEGHTLILQVMSGEIQADFGGDVGRYWAVNQQEFEQVARSLDAKRLDETEYNDKLDQQVRDLVKKSLQQLPMDARDLLLRSSVYRRPVPKKFWLAMIADRSASQQKEAYRVLYDRALVEKDATDIRQHNLIRAIAYDLLKTDTAIWESTERQAAHLWLMAYEPSPDASNLETVRGRLEAFDHHCEVEDWSMANLIALVPLKTSTKESLYLQLETWGYYREQHQICSKLLNIYQRSGNRVEEANSFLNLGNIEDSLGNYSLAINYYRYSLEIAHKIGYRKGEANALCNLGNINCLQGNIECASDYYQNSLMILDEISDRQAEANLLGNLGIIFYKQGNPQRAINYYHKQLSVVNTYSLDDRVGKATALMNLGAAYYSLTDYLEAEDLYTQALKIARKIQSRHLESSALTGLGETLIVMKRLLEASHYFQEALKICQEIGERFLEASILKNLAQLHRALGEIEVARQYCQQALMLATELGIPLADECRQLMAQLETSREVQLS